jgi:hypothetical protein
LEPFAYLPSDRVCTKDESNLAWMTYFIPVVNLDGRTGRFTMKSNLVDSLFLYCVKWITGRFTFYSKDKPLITAGRVLFNSLTSLRPVEGIKFFSKLRYAGTRLRVKHLAFENGPTVTERGDIGCCALCPNITVRGDGLVPVCLADYSHLPKEEQQSEE